MPKFPVYPKPGHNPHGPVAPVDTAEDVKLRLIAEKLKKDIDLILSSIRVDGEVIE
jgi:hypothetical protein